MTILNTERLVMVPLCAALHYGATRRMNGDEEVMRFIKGKAETPAETSAWLLLVEERWKIHGHSWWALLDHAEMVGAATLQRLANQPDGPFEIGWRLPRATHKRGYATEAARAIMKHAKEVGIESVVAVANPLNEASCAVMTRLGMAYIGIQTHYDQRVATYRGATASRAPE